MRIITAFAIVAAVIAVPATAQETNNAATTAPVENTATAPATDANLANEVVLSPGEATTVAPVEPMPTEVAPPAEEDRERRIPWGLLGLLGLVGLLGRARSSRSD